MGDDGLSLVCASIGGLQEDDDGKEHYVKSPDCLESLRDLQRYLRRDHPQTRDVFMRLGKWNIVRQDLVPLIKRYSDDFELVLNCVKVLVFLTMPVDPLSHQVSQQVEFLHHFKAAIVEGDTIAVIVSLLEEPLQHLESGSPKDDDWKMFQLFLTLLRNFLSFPNCLPQHGPSTPHLSNIRDRMLERLFNESAMELVIALTQHVAGHGGLRQDNLLILEIIQHIFWGQRPDLVAAAADKGVKSVKQSRKSKDAIRAFLQVEKEQLRKQRNCESKFTGMFVKVARDGSKTILTRNAHQSPLDSLIKKPQIRRGFVKRIVQEPHPVFRTSDHIYVLIKDFAEQFLASGYNTLMQSVKQDIRRERSGFETPDIVVFFQVAQFFTSYQCCMAQRDQNNNKKLDGGSLDGGFLDGTEKEATGQKHLCGLIASTMDEDMFNLVISKWHEYADMTESTKDWGPAAAAGVTMKDMIRMLDVVLKQSGSLTTEGQQELRTARILLYKVLYDQTENGLLHFLNSLIRLWDTYKQPRSHLADLVEMTHVVLRILDGFHKAGESLRVLKKVGGGWKKKPKPESTPSENPQSKGESGQDDARETEAVEKASETGEHKGEAGQDDVMETEVVEKAPETGEHKGEAGQVDARETEAVEKAPETGEHTSDSPQQAAAAGVSAQNVAWEVSGKEESPEKVSATEATQPQEEQVELENAVAMSSHEEDEGEENFHTTPAGDKDNDDDESDGEKQKRTKEVSLDIHSAVGKFANNVVVRNYCWLLKSFSTNTAATNYYIVRMLQRICEDCMLEPMLYQLSILQTFYSVLSNKTMQESEDHRFVIAFLSKVVRRLFKKLESKPILFVEILFWKTRTECHNISADYLIHSLRKETRGSVPSRSSQKRINIADALGDDEEEALPPMDLHSDNEGSAASSEDDDVQAPEESSSFSEVQEVQIRDLFERYKDEEHKAELIASELDTAGQYTAAQVQRKLQQLGLVQPSPFNQPKSKAGSSGQHTNEKDLGDTASQSQTRKRKSPASGEGKVTGKKSKIFSEAQDKALKELFTRFGGGKKVTRVITENMGGGLTIAQVSRRIRALGLVKPKPRTAHSLLHDNLTDSEEDGQDNLSRLVTDLPDDEGNAGLDQRGEKRTRKRKTNANDLSDSDDDILISGLAPSQKLTLNRGKKAIKKSTPFFEDQDQAPEDILKRKENGKNASQVNTDNLCITAGQASRRLRRVGLAKSDPTTALSPRHTDLIDSAEYDDLATVTDFPEDAGNTAFSEKGEKGSSRKRRTNTVDLSDSEDDLNGDLNIPAPSLVQELEDDVPIDGLSRRALRQTQELDSDDDGLMNLSSRPATRQAQHLHRDDDIPLKRQAPTQAEELGNVDAALTGLSRLVPRQAEQLDSDDEVLISGRRALRQAVELDSDDDIPLTGLSRSAPRQAEQPDSDDEVLISGRRALSQAVESDSDDDVPLTGLKGQAPRQAEKLGSQEDFLVSNLSRPAPEQAEELDSEDDAPLTGLKTQALDKFE